MLLTTLLLDTHVLLWWDVDPGRLSQRAAAAVVEADELAVSGHTWYELAWLVENGRVELDLPLASWLNDLNLQVRTVGLTPAIALTAARLPEPFPRDPADRVIYGTALDRGWQLVTKDSRLREHPAGRPVTVW